MSLALAFGFFHLVIPDFEYDFDRLHIFLFNLCAGGSILLYFTSGHKKIVPSIYVYFALSLAYALTAFLNVFWLTLIISAPMLLLVESFRINRFSLFPFDFFRAKPVSDKFLQSSLLCLSMGIAIASLVIINNEYLHLIHFEKLTIDVFFLGYSFPLSLLTFAVMFSFMRSEGSTTYKILQEVSFWTITIGVITFFIFIIFEMVVAEVIISNTLLLAVLMTFYIFVKNCLEVQQKWILMSGMFFLVLTALTGVVYLFEYLYPPLREYHDVLIMLHATIALYGWNLSGLFVVSRWDDFPIFKSVRHIIVLHWLTVIIFAPLGKHFLLFSLLALVAYPILVGTVFLSKKSKGVARF